MRYGAVWWLVILLVQAEKSNFERLKDIVTSNIPLVEPLIRSVKERSSGKASNEHHFHRSTEGPPSPRHEDKSEFEKRKEVLAQQAKKMFFHAYNSYMTYAFPADELMPVSCKGRVRGLTQPRGEVDDALGRYMLTLVDTLDTLVVLNEYAEFEDAVKLVIRGLSFDTDLVVNLFEANIRILGGLLGGHAGALHLQSKGKMMWYSNELLSLSVDIADRFLPAFDTPTGIPLPKINLKFGIFGITDNETCTACAGTLYLEFAALSRYTGNVTYEGKARAALEFLYNNRIPTSDLPGTVINVNNGQWIRKDTSVGAGIDSYYEYLIKGYIVSGDPRFWDMFSRQYQATRRYVLRGKFLMTIHGQVPTTRVRDHQDSLQAFWPGIQTMAGDISEADRVWEHYFKVSKKNHYTLPEAFLFDERMYWPQYYLRPELIESSYILYQATKDPKYVEAGARIMQAMERRCRVMCGYSSLKNTNTGELEDRLDSFVLAETFKYLYLLFADTSEVGVDMERYVLTTEAHLIPIHIQRFSNDKVNGSKGICENMGVYVWTWLERLIFGRYTDSIFPEDSCPDEDQPYFNRNLKLVPHSGGKRQETSSLRANDFDYRNSVHVAILRSMGITLEPLGGDKIQLVHNAAQAHSEQLGVEGVIFMKEITDHANRLAHTQKAQLDNIPMKEVMISSLQLSRRLTFQAGKAMFGPELTPENKVVGIAVQADPPEGCTKLLNSVAGKVAILFRGGCMFVEKVRMVQEGGGIGAVIIDNAVDSSAVLAMSGDGNNNVYIPSLFLNKEDGEALLELFRQDRPMTVIELRDATPKTE